ncbi:MAG: hypothetical protein U0587_08290 [Candidatus Binatia bacterium]
MDLCVGVSGYSLSAVRRGACRVVSRHLFGALAALLLGTARVGADVPASINYQGQVLGAGGVPATVPVNIDIGIWDSATGGARLYREQHLNTPLANGVYNILLGAGANVQGAFGVTTFAAPGRWLELAINGETLAPRQPFSSVAYALRAQQADTVDGIDGSAIVPRTGGSFTGAVAVNGPNGSGNVFLGAGSDPNFGFVGALNSGGQIRASLAVVGAGDGSVSAYRANGSLATLMGAVGSGGLVTVMNGDGNVASFSATDRGAGMLEMLGPNGKRNALLGASPNNANRGTLTLNDAQGVTKVLLIVDDNSQGIVDVVNTKNLPAVGVRVLSGGDGMVFLEGPQGDLGNINVLLGAVSGDPNRGSIAVADANSAVRAGLFVNSFGQGQVFADVKNFVVDHPTQPGKKIVYASLEGPEVALYHRGVTRLVDGRATVVLPEHFVALAVPGTATVQLTPVSLESQGLGVAGIHADRIEIGELHQGTGSYDVHFVVHALRRGYERHQAVVSTEAFGSGAALSGAGDPVEILKPPVVPRALGGSAAGASATTQRAEVESVVAAVAATSAR